MEAYRLIDSPWRVSQDATLEDYMIDNCIEFPDVLSGIDDDWLWGRIEEELKIQGIYDSWIKQYESN